MKKLIVLCFFLTCAPLVLGGCAASFGLQPFPASVSKVEQDQLAGVLFKNDESLDARLKALEAKAAPKAKAAPVVPAK